MLHMRWSAGGVVRRLCRVQKARVPVRISPARHAPRQERVASLGPLARYPAVWLARNLTVQVKDKLINFDAGRPGCGHLRESLLSRLLRAFCLKSERASALYNVGIHWSPVGFH